MAKCASLQAGRVLGLHQRREGAHQAEALQRHVQARLRFLRVQQDRGCLSSCASTARAKKMFEVRKGPADADVLSVPCNEVGKHGLRTFHAHPARSGRRLQRVPERGEAQRVSTSSWVVPMQQPKLQAGLSTGSQRQHLEQTLSELREPVWSSESQGPVHVQEVPQDLPGGSAARSMAAAEVP